jgi:tRNA modification GTPase
MGADGLHSRSLAWANFPTAAAFTRAINSQSFYGRHLTAAMSRRTSPPRRRQAWSVLPANLKVRCCSVSTPATRATKTSLEAAYLPNDTIFALSSGTGVATGVAVIRVSGASAFDITRGMLTSPSLFPEPRVAALRRLRDPVTNEVLDQALVLAFPGPRSFTGEDVVELHLHGSRAVVAGVTNALASSGAARPAERGEFTRRAFENGRMDLTEVEGLADLIAADTAEQRRQALRQLGGDVRAVFEGWREELKNCLAHAEAVIDFGDDVDDGAFEAVIPRVSKLRAEMVRRLNDDRRGEIVRGGVRVAIVGPPNAGKSTLLNILARRPAAIVSPVAGTTRDIVEVSLDMSGVPVIVSDTAGLREHTNDPVEIEGIRRARQAAAAADVTLFVQDASLSSFNFESFDSKAALEALYDVKHADGNGSNSDGAETEGPLSSAMTPAPMLLVANKLDLVEADNAAKLQAPSADGDRLFRTSLKDGVGVDALVNGLEDVIQERISGCSGGDVEARPDAEAPIITRARHRYHVEQTVRAIEAFEAGRTGANRAYYLPMDLATEELRIACRELGAVTGAIHVEEVLDVVFSSFCIGK